MTERADMEAVLEAILFVSNDPVPADKLLAIFDEKEREAAAEALQAVQERYREPGRGFQLDEAAGGLRLVTRPDLHGYLRRFFDVSSSNKLTMPALETLAIIAYRQPITGPEIQELRSVNSAGVLRTLLERRLVRIAGRKEVVGKPFLYATTREFLMHFGLRSLKELPPLEQFEELFGGDTEAAPVSPEPDMEEEVLRQASLLAEQEDEMARTQELDAVDAERAAAEAAEPFEEPPAGDPPPTEPPAEDPPMDEPPAEDPPPEKPPMEAPPAEAPPAKEPA